ncbi:MAG TPA: hypothetical protein VFY34_04690, partial [Pyrinomonadaceae bacterium]|nr:hypothetical protein [Pyrinomonadaceae bacterium]
MPANYFFVAVFRDRDFDPEAAFLLPPFFAACDLVLFAAVDADFVLEADFEAPFFALALLPAALFCFRF